MDLAGLKEPPLPLEIDLIFISRDFMPSQLILTLRSWSTAKLEVTARVETQEESTTMPTDTESPTLHANSTLPRTLVTDVDLLTFAEIAHGHPQMLERLVSINAGPSPTPISMPQTITM